MKENRWGDRLQKIYKITESTEKKWKKYYGYYVKKMYNFFHEIAPHWNEW